MSWTTGLAIYFVAWWIVLFAVLPFGVRSQEEQGAVSPGTDPGAPAVPLLARKLIWTTIVTSCSVRLLLLAVPDPKSDARRSRDPVGVAVGPAP